MNSKASKSKTLGGKIWIAVLVAVLSSLLIAGGVAPAVTGGTVSGGGLFF